MNIDGVQKFFKTFEFPDLGRLLCSTKHTDHCIAHHFVIVDNEDQHRVMADSVIRRPLIWYLNCIHFVLLRCYQRSVHACFITCDLKRRKFDN